MKSSKWVFSISLATLLISTPAFAGRDSGGAPDVPVQPPEKLAFACKIEMERINADGEKRNTTKMESQTEIKYDPTDKQFFNGNIELNDLRWTQSSDHKKLEVALTDQQINISFEKKANKLNAVLLVVGSMKSEDKKHGLSSYRFDKQAFAPNLQLTAEVNVEERAEWIENKQPVGDLMNFFSLKVDCLRTK